MKYIKVWCEYDINGDFGGNNNEAVFQVSDETDVCKVVALYVDKVTGESPEELEGLYDWEYLNIPELK